MNKQKIATVFGGTGFIGRQVVRELAKEGFIVKVATRVPERAYFLKLCGAVGQIVPVACDYSDPKAIESAVKDSCYVVNAVGILHQKRKSSFQKIHVDIAQAIAKACKKVKTERFVHISALGAEKGTSKYAKTKLEGEKAVRKTFPQATILRPSVVFGPEDDFFNMFAELARYFPVLPLIGGGNTKFQPVYVGDVADAVIRALFLPAREDGPCGKTYELGGPEVVTFKEIYARLFKYTRRKRFLISLPWSVAKIQAGFMCWLPKPPLTSDQVESLKTDIVVGKKALKLQDLDIAPTGMSLILPTYLERYCPGGHYSNKKRA